MRMFKKSGVRRIFRRKIFRPRVPEAPAQLQAPPEVRERRGRGQLSAPALTFGGELTGAAVVHLIMLRLGQRDQIPSAIGKFRIILGRPDVVHDLRRDRHAEAQTLLAERILAQDLSAEPPPSVVFSAVIKSRQTGYHLRREKKKPAPTNRRSKTISFMGTGFSSTGRCGCLSLSRICTWGKREESSRRRLCRRGG